MPRKSPIPTTTEELSPPPSPRPAAIPFTIPSVLSSLRRGHGDVLRHQPCQGGTPSPSPSPPPPLQVKRLFLAIDYKDLGQRTLFLCHARLSLPSRCQLCAIRPPGLPPLRRPCPPTTPPLLPAISMPPASCRAPVRPRSPYAPMTRAMVATVLYRMAGGASGFRRRHLLRRTRRHLVPRLWPGPRRRGHPRYQPYHLLPDSQVTPEQLATMLWRYGAALRPVRARLWTSPTWADLSTAADAMTWAVDQKIVQGIQWHPLFPGNRHPRASSRHALAPSASLGTRTLPHHF